MDLSALNTALNELGKSSPYAIVLVICLIYTHATNKAAGKRVDRAYDENCKSFDKILESSSKDLRENIKTLQEQNRYLLGLQGQQKVLSEEILPQKNKRK